MKQYIFLFLLLFCVSGTYAMNLTGGESITFDVGEEFEYYDVVDNSTTLDYVNITSEGTNITIDVGLLASADTFTIIFFDQEEIIKEVHVGGGGGTRTIYKDRNITEYVDRDVEKIVEVENDDEINRLLGVANDAVKGEHNWKLLFVLSCAIILVIVIIKIKNAFE